MKNLKKVESYNIGLDVGTGSVGWAVTDETGELCTFKGKPTWGSRLFPSAESAESARVYRGQRRRYDIRRQRLDLLQKLFAEEMEKTDPEFFVRLNQSRLLSGDRAEGHGGYQWPFFNDSDFTEIDYYKKFPTIYHLRAWLMETDEQADIRLIYLAFHNIVKARGNFLYQDNSNLSAENAKMTDSVESLCVAIEEWFAQKDIELEAAPDPAVIEGILNDKSLYRSDKAKKIEAALRFPKEKKKAATALARLIVGYKAEVAEVLAIEPDESNFALSDDEKVELFREKCPDDGVALFEAVVAVYSAVVLSSILKGADGKTISFCKIAEYEKYGEDLRTLKALVREYIPQSYNKIFRGELIKDEEGRETGKYAPWKASGYTKFNLVRGTAAQEEFYKEVRKLLKDAGAGPDERFKQIEADINENTFLRRLKTSNNGVIPYQLHLEEMHSIIEKQSVYYPFLSDKYNGQNKIEYLVTFRIPYYVGPLTQKNARTNSAGKNRFAWSERIEGKEGEKIYPWNWDEIIDRDKSAEGFMNRMIGECTYLKGEQVLPRCSIMYESFCVLNELAGARWSNDGDKTHRFDASDRMGLFDEVFKSRKTVSYKCIVDWLEKHGHFGHIEVEGAQGVAGFESKMSSYIDFCKLLECDELSDRDVRMAEEIILWNTLFEDRDILKRKIRQAYGDRLTEKQIKAICKKRYTGWGRLSKKLLAGIKMPADSGDMTVMDLLLEGDPNNSRRIGSAMTFMEILNDDRLKLQERIDEHNAKTVSQDFVLEELPGSPALRRSVNQSLRIVEEIVKIAGKAPANVFIEVARDPETPYQKGRRTQRRLNTVKQALEAFKKEDKDLWDELNAVNGSEFSDRMELYFRQRGKSMYSGKPLDINELSHYHIDHIIPQAYIKDDSIDNKVLVFAEENERKIDSLLLDDSIRRKMSAWWRELHDAGLISDKKYNNLTRSKLSDAQMKGFIARQLVETSQIVKALKGILEQRYEETAVTPVKAALSSQLRESCGLVKCREANDYHHAHDAYLACEMGRFIAYRHGEYLDEPIRMARVMRQYVRKMGENYKYQKRALGSAGFFVESFKRSGFDPETGEVFQDAWDAEGEIARLHKCLNYKTCYISRMPEETSGAFWKATLYSPYDPKISKYDLPPKGNLNPAKYGTYTTEQFAYFFVYEALDKKSRRAIRFAPVPVRFASAIADDSKNLERYAEQHAQGEGLTFVRVLKRKIYKYQMIEIDGCRLYITGQKEVRNAQQFAFSENESKVIKSIVDGACANDDDLNALYASLEHKFQRYAPRLGCLLRISELAVLFEAASLPSKGDALLKLISIACGKVNMVDLSSVGGLKCAGCQQVAFSGVLTKGQNEFWFIDQSVTGMHERRYKLEL